MNIADLDVHDDTAVAQLLELQRAVAAADQPEHPGPCGVALPATLRQPRPGDEYTHRVVRADGRIVGYLEVRWPMLDNLHFAGFDVQVHPEYRRRGIGRRLLEHALDLARQAGRNTVTGWAVKTWQDGPQRPVAAQRLLESMDFTPAITTVNRRMDLHALDPAVEEQMYQESLAKSSGYELITFTGATPEELLPGLARINSTILEEVPLGDLELEPERIDADLQRERDRVLAARGIFKCSTLARHVESGDIVANTVLIVRAEPGDHAGQGITIVSPKHRGHRLGLLTKIANQRKLRAERPAVRWIWTDNADVNDHMIAINAKLGFETVDAEVEYQRKL